MHEVCALNIVKYERRTEIGGHSLDLDVTQVESFYVANKKTMCGQRAEAVGIGIDLLDFRR